MYGINNVRQTEVQQNATEELTVYKSPGNDKIPVELIKAEVEQFIFRSINLLFLFRIRRNCPTRGVNHCTYEKKDNKTICNKTICNNY